MGDLMTERKGSGVQKEKRQYPDADHLVSSYFHLSLPVVLGSIVTIVYNLADTYFIARTGNALLVAGVSLCAPLFMILMALGNIFGQGGSSLISRLLGKQDHEAVARVSAFCFYIALAVGAAVRPVHFGHSERRDCGGDLRCLLGRTAGTG